MFGRKSVDSITMNLMKMVSDLQDLVDTNNSKIQSNNEVISLMNADNAVLFTEVIRANKVSKKLEELLSI